RILNILYLVQQGLLDLPILYLSQYIIKNKSKYYQLLQSVRDDNNWDEWVIYLINGVELTAKDSIKRITNIRNSMQETKQYLRKNHPKTYSQDLLNNIYRHPYTKINLIADDLQVHSNTARTYLTVLVDAGVLREHKIGRGLYFINTQLISILAQS
ncbi:MAG: Fic family protein, partial [Bacteroidota bacterium]